MRRSDGLGRRVFGEGQNPLDWAFPLYEAWGIRVRVHAVFVIYIVMELIVAALQRDVLGWSYVATGLAWLFGLVLLHEYGHCVACRRVGGSASEILMWPLGGLAYVSPPDWWKAHLWTTIGGPAVNAILMPLLGGALLAITQDWRSVVFNPFDPGNSILFVQTPSGARPFWLSALWMGHLANLALLAFNVLVPMYPMDGGRIVQAVLWARLGWRRSMEISVQIGLVAAVALFIAGMVGNETTLMALAIFGGFICWMERQRLRFAATGGEGFLVRDAADEERARVAAAKRREQEAAKRAEIDRILDKIHEQGLASLTAKEKRILKNASENPKKP